MLGSVPVTPSSTDDRPHAESLSRAKRRVGSMLDYTVLTGKTRFGWIYFSSETRVHELWFVVKRKVQEYLNLSFTCAHLFLSPGTSGAPSPSLIFHQDSPFLQRPPPSPLIPWRNVSLKYAYSIPACCSRGQTYSGMWLSSSPKKNGNGWHPLRGICTET